MWNSLLRNGQSVIRQQQCVVTYTSYNIQYARKSNLKSLKNEVYHARNEKPLKNHSLDVAKKYLETDSPSNAAARNLGEEVQTNP